MELLPEECVAEILSRTSPRDACRSLAISRSFKSIAESDAVWDKFLPSDLPEILSTAQSTPVIYSTKKHLYFRLANLPLILHGGNLSLALDRESGKKCYMLGARKLTITWGTSPQYWKWTSYRGSRFHEVVVLQGVWWLEIFCKIETRCLSPNTVYVAFLVFKFERWAYGFSSLPISVSFKSIDKMGDENGSEMMTTTVYLRMNRSGPIHAHMSNAGWFEVELGEFSVDPDDNRQVEIRIYEVELGVPKGGLIVEGIELRPKVIE